MSIPNPLPEDATGSDRLDAVAILARLVKRLTFERPTDPMRESVRHTLALRYAEARYGYGTAHAARAEQAALTLAPRIDREITRGEYALILTRVLDGAR
ncbi:hypothetical protein [Streptomyces sp. NRRL F-5630]|uniref:hypothetical protein n=1 Tax=Streptomyces sp. NRRL F-5630 TaxID=1463864 RepID=UPI003D72C034